MMGGHLRSCVDAAPKGPAARKQRTRVFGPLVGQVLQAQRPTNRKRALFQGCFVGTLKKKELFTREVFAGAVLGVGHTARARPKVELSAAA